jgi:hypothetical protein
MIEIITTKSPEAFHCPHCNLKIKGHEDEEDFEINYCDHVAYLYVIDEINYLSQNLKNELKDKGYEIEDQEGFIEISDLNNEDFSHTDLPEIVGDKYVIHHEFSHLSMVGNQIYLGIYK